MIDHEMRQKLLTFGIETIRVGVLLAIAEESEDPTQEEIELLRKFKDDIRPLYASETLGQVAILKKENGQWTFRRPSWTHGKWGPVDMVDLKKILHLIEVTS
jgi:hypothetical protein